MTMTDTTKRSHRWRYEQKPQGRIDLHLRQVRKRRRERERALLVAGRTGGAGVGER